MSSRISSCRRQLAGAALIALACPAALHAQDTQPQAVTDSQGLQDIIVTAQRRAENVQNVPIAVTAVTGSALESAGISGTNALPQITPSVTFTRSGPSGLFFIRGVGTTNAAAGEEGANAFYVDGVYIADLGQTINNFNNVERIEVLKGPQGTLFGRNATGGLIQVITRDPGDETVIKGKVGYGNYETSSGQIYAATPITDNLSADIAATGTSQTKGWGYNVTQNKETRLGGQWGVRSKWVWKPGDIVKFTLAGDYYRISENNALAWRIADGYLGIGGTTSPCCQNASANDPQHSALKIWGVSLKTEADLGFASLTNLLSYRKTENHSFLDVDGGPSALLRFDYVSGTRSFQEELRLASTETKPLSWQAGLFYLRSVASNDQKQRGLAFGGLNNGSNILAKLVTDSWAAFGELSYDITPTTHLTGGARYTEDKRMFRATQTAVANNVPGAVLNFPSNGDVFDRLSYNEWSYRAALRQDITDRINAYASFNHGFKAGTYSLQAPTQPAVRPQFIDAFEIGLKSELFDRKLRINLAAYHYDITDYQIRSVLAGTTALFNAGTVKVDGFDAEFEAAPLDNWRVYGGLTILDSHFGYFPNALFYYPTPATCTTGSGTVAAPPGVTPGAATGPATGGVTPCLGSAAGLTTPLAPKFTANLGGTYTIPLGEESKVLLNGLYSYNSGYAFEPDGVQRQASFSLINASVEYRINEHFGVELWGNNLLNTRYYAQKITTAPFAALSSLSAPLTYGVNVKFDF
ncbi:MAG TPA: TonB-dependent receptor [Sphingobium sp.]|uniref:TonB-dependent receptor n=1 Tax=Sphingobium sp. TaxID=1912891 RepID=UPI002ED19A85